ncbi:MAG: hypothetical protein U1A78_09080 [Polyangia bacterium]
MSRPPGRHGERHGERHGALAGLLLGLSACVSPTPPGLGAPGPGASARLAGLPALASAAAVQRACAVATSGGASERAQRKAIELGLDFVTSYPQAPERGAVMQWVTPVAESVVGGPHACAAAPEVGRLYFTGGDFNRAGDVFVRAARQCGSVEAARLSVDALGRVNRCGEAIEAIQAVWPRAQQADWPGLLDGVAQCSSPIALRQNLSFVPEAVRTSFLEERERQRQAAEQAAYEAAEAARRAHAEQRCLSECSYAESSCRSSCNGHSPCLQRCDAMTSTCRSGCYR